MFVLARDSMRSLDAHLAIEGADIERLLTEDPAFRRTLYSVPTAGRELLNEPLRRGVEFGHGSGDLQETTTHVALIDALCRFLRATAVADSDAPVTDVVPYYEVDDARFDVVGLDGDGEIRVVGEAERPNNDVRETAPRDFDQMAAVEADRAIWVAPSRTAAHEAVVQPLAEPADGEPRIEADYST
ncbi:MAG: hypothetical protein ABEJ44_00485, partial [Halanaeroarchaeum sp.]